MKPSRFCPPFRFFDRYPSILLLLLIWPTSGFATTIYGFGGHFIDNGDVRTTTYFNGDLIVGGYFSSVAGVTGSRNLALWNGTDWVGMNMPGAKVLVGAGSGVVEALAVHQGELYVAGWMQTADGAPSEHIIRWDGTNWLAVGERGVGEDTPGFDGRPLALLSSGNDLYIGGQFLIAGGVEVNRVARWDGTAWNAMGTGLNSSVVALVEYGGEIVAGGYFSLNSEATAGVAAWDGQEWHQLGQDLGDVHDLAVFNGVLIAAGEFTLNEGSGLAWLDGDRWRALGGGTDGFAEALTVADGKLYVAGGFSNVGSGAGTVPAQRIAAWDGTAWSDLSPGIDYPHDSPVINDLASNGSDVVVGGYFQIAGGLDAPNLAIWNGSAWNNDVSNCGNGLNRPATALLTTSDGSLVVGGSFTRAGGMPATQIARWDGEWHAYGNGLDRICCMSQVNALVELNGAIVAGGSFDVSGTQPVNSIAQWDGTAWVPLGSGLNNTVYALAVYNGDLIAGGAFTTADGQPANRVARWDGTAWHPMGGLANTVQALTVYNGDLFAGGLFAGGLAKWNGASWSVIDWRTWVGITASVSSMTILGGDLIVAGGNHLSRSNGISWSSMPSPMGGPYFIENYFETLVGSGTLSSGQSGVLGLDPTNGWYLLAEATGNGDISPFPMKLLAHDGSFVKALVVGGDFVQLGGAPSSRIAFINPEWKFPTSVRLSSFLASPDPKGILLEWATSSETDFAGFHVNRSTQADGSYERVTTDLIRPGDDYRFFDTEISPGITYYYRLEALDRTGSREFFGPVSAQIEPGGVARISRLQLFPNPFQRSLAIRFSLEAPAQVEVTVFDVAGRRVATVLDRTLPAGSHEASWDGRDRRGQRVKAGTYFIRAREGDRVESRQVVLVD